MINPSPALDRRRCNFLNVMPIGNNLNTGARGAVFLSCCKRRSAVLWRVEDSRGYDTDNSG